MAAKQRRWQPFPSRSHIFRDCVFFVQSAKRLKTDLHGDLALIKASSSLRLIHRRLTLEEHGGMTIADPLGDAQPTHIVVAIKGSPADYCFDLELGHPHPLPHTHTQPDDWQLEDLVAYALERQRLQNPVIIVQLPWLRECLHTGVVLDHREDYAGWEVRPSHWRRRHLDTPLPRSKRQESRRLNYDYGKRLTYGSPPLSPKVERSFGAGNTAAGQSPLFAQINETAQPWRKWLPNTPQGRRIDRYDTPAQQPGCGSPGFFLPPSRHGTPMLSKTKKHRVVSSASVVHDGPRPSKKSRTRSELRDGTVSPPRLISTPSRVHADSALLKATPSALLEDIFVGTTAYIDERVPTETGVKGLFTNFGGKVVSHKEADYVVFNALPGAELETAEECKLAIKAVARGAYAVSTEWVNESVLSDKIAPPDDFVVRPRMSFTTISHFEERQEHARGASSFRTVACDPDALFLTSSYAGGNDDTPLLNYASDGDEAPSADTEPTYPTSRSPLMCSSKHQRGASNVASPQQGEVRRTCKRKRALSDVEPDDLEGVKRRALNSADCNNKTSVLRHGDIAEQPITLVSSSAHSSCLGFVASETSASEDNRVADNGKGICDPEPQRRAEPQMLT